MNNNQDLTKVSAVNIIKVVALSFVVFFLCRLTFFLFNYDEFAHFSGGAIMATFFYGLLFDFSAIVYLNSLFILLSLIPFDIRAKKSYQHALKGSFLLSNVIALLLNLIDTAYYPFSKKRTGIEIWRLKNYFTSMLGDAVLFYWYFILGFLFAIILLVYIYNKWVSMSAGESTGYSGPWWKRIGLIVIVISIWIVAARGGFYMRPIRPFDAARFVNTDLIPLTLNSPFQLLTSIDAKPTVDYHYFDSHKLRSLLNPIKTYQSKATPHYDNVVVILLESFGQEYIGYYNKKVKNTPFLDSLLRNSLVFKNAFANGTRTLDALPSVQSSIPSMMDQHYLYSMYSDNNIESIGGALSKKGYNTSFYHGGPLGTYGLDNFIRVSSSGKYYSQEDYPDQSHDDKEWGIFDDKYLEYFSSELDKKPQPFFSSILTLSLHPPYVTPVDYKNSLKGIKKPFERSVAYVDMSLRKFFSRSSTKAWFANTLFVLVADHTSDSFDESYQNSLGKYSIPIAFYKPASDLKGVDYETMQQIDIFPTILAYLNYPDSFYSLGRNAFDKGNFSYAVQYVDGIYQIIHHPFILKYNPARDKIEGFYDHSKDPFLQKNIDGNDELKARMQNQLKAFIQTYTQGLSRNNMHVPKIIEQESRLVK
ncbi:MAG TPA: sulfatase-like hydrolase/transferase [Cytophagaceae bacterium]|jgi:phosphoglycerol transferase MdoB-like AlkP superfamily enzyme